MKDVCGGKGVTTKALFTVRDREGNKIQIEQNQQALLGSADESLLNWFKCQEVLFRQFEMICKVMKVTATAYGSGHGRLTASPLAPCLLLKHENKNSTSTLTRIWD